MSEIARDLHLLEDDLERLASALVNQRLLHRLGLAQIRQIQQRTRKGRDVEGKSFRPYSEPYAALKREAGLPTSPVTLRHGVRREKAPQKGQKGPVKASLYDSMLDYVDHVVASDLESVELVITRADKRLIASYHSVDGAGRSKVIREFWGISDEEQDRLQTLVEEDVAQLLSTANLTD